MKTVCFWRPARRAERCGTWSLIHARRWSCTTPAPASSVRQLDLGTCGDRARLSGARSRRSRSRAVRRSWRGRGPSRTGFPRLRWRCVVFAARNGVDLGRTSEPCQRGAARSGRRPSTRQHRPAEVTRPLDRSEPRSGRLTSNGPLLRCERRGAVAALSCWRCWRYRLCALPSASQSASRPRLSRDRGRLRVVHDRLRQLRLRVHDLGERGPGESRTSWAAHRLAIAKTGTGRNSDGSRITDGDDERDVSAHSCRAHGSTAVTE